MTFDHAIGIKKAENGWYVETGEISLILQTDVELLAWLEKQGQWIVREAT